MNWGHYITLSFVAFAIVIFTMVTISMNQDVSLVADDYYKQEIAYQDQIDKISNFKELAEKPDFRLNSAEGIMQISFPIGLAGQLSNGTIQLYRPSESGADKLIAIELEKDGSQNISMKGFKKGLWKAKINFQLGNNSYYHEKNVIL